MASFYASLYVRHSESLSPFDLIEKYGLEINYKNAQLYAISEVFPKRTSEIKVFYGAFFGNTSDPCNFVHFYSRSHVVF